MKKAAEIQMLKDFSNANATSGFENEFVDLFTKTVKDYADLEVDGMLNVYASKKQNTGKRPVIQLDAHSDAVGFLTQAIRPNGLIKFVTLGGWNNVVLPALKVKVRNRDGEYIPGVVALKPPHFMSEAERKSVPQVADLSIDVGSSSREETINDYRSTLAARFSLTWTVNTMKRLASSSARTLTTASAPLLWLTSWKT